MDFNNVFKTKDSIIERHSIDTMVINGDSLVALKQIKDNIVDLVFADPPYNIGKDFGNNKDEYRRYVDVGCLKLLLRWLQGCILTFLR